MSLVKVIVALGCGYVVFGAPSEVDQLAVGQAVGRGPALAMLFLIASGSLAAAVSPRALPCATVIGLRVAGAALCAYGLFAVAIKGAVALPTAALAMSLALLYIDRAATLSESRPDLHHR